jgi:hypothetical protein
MTNIEDAVPYGSLSLNERVHIALELGESISMNHHQFFMLASAIVEQLTPKDGEACDKVGALRVAEELMERMRDMRQHCNLMDCLDSMRASTAH